jgi:hypothetical protein
MNDKKKEKKQKDELLLIIHEPCIFVRWRKRKEIEISKANHQSNRRDFPS